MSGDGLSPVERQEYLAKINQLSRENVIQSKGFLDLFGTIEGGEFVLAPNSYTRGYRHSFLPSNQRPYLLSNFLGIFGQLSDHTWVFIPSYNRGITYGNERQNNLKMAVLAEGEKRLFQELNTQRQTQSELAKRLEDAQEKIRDLEKRISEQEQREKSIT